MNSAINAVKHQNLTISKAADIYKVPCRTLYDKLNKIMSEDLQLEKQTSGGMTYYETPKLKSRKLRVAVSKTMASNENVGLYSNLQKSHNRSLMDSPNQFDSNSSMHDFLLERSVIDKSPDATPFNSPVSSSRYNTSSDTSDHKRVQKNVKNTSSVKNTTELEILIGKLNKLNTTVKLVGVNEITDDKPYKDDVIRVSIERVGNLDYRARL